MMEIDRGNAMEKSELSAAPRAIVGFQDFERAARSIFDSCKDLIGATGGYVALSSQDGTEFDVLFFDPGEAACTVDPDLPMPIRGLRERAYRTGTPVYENGFSDSAWAKLLPQGHLALDNVLFAPLVIDRRTVGLLGLANKAGGFTGDDARIASVFGELAALALLNSRSPESLQSSEERFRAVAQTAGDAIVMVDGQAHILFWNRAAATMFGYSEAEAAGKPLTLIMPERYRAAHLDGLERLASGGQPRIVGKTVEMAGLNREGHEFPIELSLSSWEAGDATLFTGIIRDITERVRAGEARRASEARWQSLVDNVPNFITIVGRDGLIEFINHPVPGLMKEQVVGSSVYDFVQPEYRDLARHKIEGVFRTGQADYYVSTATGPDGSVAWYENHLGPIMRDSQVVAVTIVGSDITERRRAEESLQSTTQLLGTVLEHTHVSVAYMDAQFNFVTVNRAYADADEREPSFFAGKNHFDLYPNAENEMIFRRVVETGEPHFAYAKPFEYAGHPERGTTYWDWSLVPVQDPKGAVAGLVLTLANVTGQEQARKALRESEERWRSLTEHSPDYIALLDQSANILFVNHAMPGLTKEDVIGTSFYDYALQEYRQRTQQCFERVLQTGEPDRFESVYRYEDGTRQYFESHVGPVISGGKVVGLTVSSRDISGRKRLEEALRERTQELGERVKELDCLYGISSLVERPGISLDEILQGTVDLVPTAWQYPEIACARIVVEDQELRTGGYEDSAWKQTAGISVRGHRVGTLEVCYVAERPESHEGPFLKEERSLIDAIAERLGRTIERQQAEELLREQNQFISTVFESLAHPFYVLDADDYTIKMANPAVQVGEWPEPVTCYALTHRRSTPCDTAEHLCPLEEIRQTRRPVVTEHIHYDAEGNRAVYEVHAHPILDRGGNVSQIIEYTLDITERRRAEEALLAARDELELRVQQRTADLAIANEELRAVAAQNAALYERERVARHTAETLSAASLALTETLDLNVVMNTLLDYLRQVVPYDSASIVWPQDETHVVVRAVRGRERWMDGQEVLGATIDAQSNPYIHALLTTEESILIPDTRADPEWKHHTRAEHVLNWLGVPLVAGGRVIGLCGLDKSEPGFFTQQHVQSAEALVSQAAVAVQNAWLFDQVRAGRERMRSLSHRLVEVQEAERRYIARELHDEAGQALTSLMLGLGLLEREVDRPEAIVASVAELKQMVDGVLENLHRLAADLRPASLDHLGLVAALRQYAQAISDRHGLVVQFETAGFDARLSPDVETALYRIVQEALTNVIRHARATRADILLTQRGDKLVAVIEDNGVGFDPVSAVQSGRMGLLGIRERAEMLGGTLVVESAGDVGTTLLLKVPYANPDTHRG